MAGISAFINGVPREMFHALAETDDEGEALHSLHQSRQQIASDTPDDFNEMEPGDLAGTP